MLSESYTKFEQIIENIKLLRYNDCCAIIIYGFESWRGTRHMTYYINAALMI